ncbi:caveolin-1 [Aplysia californica]|uniref:Caveolin n=1 Tax=Aplysia californica TaxID=6500 RepID=A0ABM1A9Y4_APLCA|nr:caveolin-1 [Aplysia californica]
MNDHVKVTFEEIFAEPHPTVYSFDGVWTTSYKVFTNTKLWCYRISTLLCAVPLSVFWGIYFALLACCTIWCCRPCIKAYEIELSCVRGFVVAVLDAIYRPCYETMGYLFFNIRVKVLKQVE